MLTVTHVETNKIKKHISHLFSEVMAKVIWLAIEHKSHGRLIQQMSDKKKNKEKQEKGTQANQENWVAGELFKKKPSESAQEIHYRSKLAQIGRPVEK